jgi:hypothetical protein
LGQDLRHLFDEGDLMPDDDWPDSNERNIFAEAIEDTQREPISRYREPDKPFFHAAIEQDKLKQQARNMTRQDMFNNGLLTVEDMDDEELRCGRMRDAAGRIPKVTKTMEMVPRDLYDEMVREHLSRTQEKFRQQLDTALDTMVEIMTDVSAEPRDRADAAKYLMERVMGKPQERVQVTVTKAPWEEIAMDLGRVTRAEHERRKLGNAIDAEVVEDVPEPHTEANEPQQRTSEPSATEVVPDGIDTTPPAFRPAPKAPSHDAPASSNPVAEVQQNTVVPTVVPPEPTNSERMGASACDAAHIAALRKAAHDRIQAAKKRRIVQRAMGSDALQRNNIAAAEVPNDDDATTGRISFTID